MKDRGFRRVQVLGFAITNDPPTKCDDTASEISDRKHDPISKTIIDLLIIGVSIIFYLIFLDNYACINQQLPFMVGFCKQRVEVIPPWWCESQAKVTGDFTRQTSRLQIVNRDVARGMLSQLVTIKD